MGYLNIVIIVVIFIVFGVLFIVLVSCGCYIYKMKRLCNKLKVEFLE